MKVKIIYFFVADVISALNDHIDSLSSNGNSKGVALVYIDNSNIFINTQLHSAKVRKLRSGFKHDKLCRIDVGRLVANATTEYGATYAKLYGSEPPKLDTVWKSIREKKIMVKTHKRSGWTNKEKQIDTHLVADAVDDLNKCKTDNGNENGTIILFTGDKDVLPVIQKAIENSWRTEIWSYKISLANDIDRIGRCNPERVRVVLMDDMFDKYTFRQTRWVLPYIPADRTLILL